MTGSLFGVCPRCLVTVYQTAPACPQCSYPSAPPSFSRAYTARLKRRAVKEFEKDAPRMAAHGYVEFSTSWGRDEHDRSTMMAAGIAFGLVGALITRYVIPPTGALTVIYRRSDVSPEDALPKPTEPVKWTSSESD